MAFCSTCGNKSGSCTCTRADSKSRSRERRGAEDEETLLERIAEKAADKAAEKVCQRAAEIAIKKVDEKYAPQIEDCQKGIEELRTQVKSLEATAASRAAATAETAPNGLTKQAWLGGFVPMEKSAIEGKAKEIVGNPLGLVEVRANGTVSTGVVVEFDTIQHMKSYVTEHATSVLAPLYLRWNRGPRNQHEKSINEKVTEAWNSLTLAGIPKEKLRANSRKGIVWVIGGNGVATTAATVENLTILWGPGAPDSLRK